VRILTDRQREILAMIDAFHAGHGYPPTTRQLMVLAGAASPNGMQGHIVALSRKGFVSRLPGRTRTLKIVARDDGDARLVAGAWVPIPCHAFDVAGGEEGLRREGVAG